ncbi:hypothetical protein BH24ACI3_BH24ACI3_01750 [soil metagenome]
MNDDKNSSQTAQNEEDLNTTPPNPTHVPDAPPPAESKPGAGQWEMPKPVFRKTSGYLPQGYAKTVPGSEDATIDPNPQAVPNNEIEVTTDEGPALVEPQPDLSEVIIPEPEFDAVASAANTRKSNGLVLTVLGLLFIVGFIAVFLAVIYLFILRPGGTDGIF